MSEVMLAGMIGLGAGVWIGGLSVAWFCWHVWIKPLLRSE